VQSVWSLGPHHKRIPLAVAVRKAREAWIAGDYETTLLRLDEAGDSDSIGDLRDESLLLRARALYRMLRYADMIEVLGPLVGTFGSADATATARMLLGTALARAGEIERGLEELTQAAADAEASGAHRAIQAELAHARALAHWLQGEYQQALRFAAAAERADADVISVRAAQLRGFIAVSQEKFPEALRLFRSALARYRLCHERDESLVEQTVLQVASLELTLCSVREPGTHRAPEARRVRPWEQSSSGSCSTACVQRMAMDGWLYALDGDPLSALALMRQADDLAPTAAWRVWALAQRAGLALAFGEPNSARDLAAQAQSFRDIDWEATEGEERIGLLLLAEVLASLALPAAPALVARYDGLAPLNRNNVLAGDPRERALELHVRGIVARASGDIPRARTLLKDATRVWRGIGNLWRTALALIELDATISGSIASVSLEQRMAPGAFYLEAASLIVREHFPRSFLARRVGGWLTAYHDPVAAALAPHKRQVLRLVLAGLDNKQVAVRLGLRYNSVRSYLAEIHTAFGTHSDRELFAECMRRGIGVPPLPTASPRAG
jgi:DNA-binding CsgD family transcriptional regulator/tetratricopeptide (TPR) repeat protein